MSAETYIGYLLEKNNISLKEMSTVLQIPLPMMEDYTKKSRYTMLGIYDIAAEKYDGVINTIRDYVLRKKSEEFKKGESDKTNINKEEVNNTMNEEVNNTINENNNIEIEKELSVLVEKINNLSQINFYEPYDSASYFSVYKDIIKYKLKPEFKKINEMADYLDLSRGTTWLSRLGTPSGSPILELSEFISINADIGLSKNLLIYPDMKPFHQELNKIIINNKMNETEFLNKFSEFLINENDDDFKYSITRSTIINHLKVCLANYNIIIGKTTHIKILSFLLYNKYITEDKLSKGVINIIKKSWNNRKDFKNNYIPEKKEVHIPIKNIVDPKVKLLKNIELLDEEDIKKLLIHSETLLKDKEKVLKEKTDKFINKLKNDMRESGLPESVIKEALKSVF